MFVVKVWLGQKIFEEAHIHVHNVKYNIKKKRNVVVYTPAKEVFSGYIGITLICPSVHMSRIRKPS